MPDNVTPEFSVTTGELVGSKKVYVEGSDPSIRVGMREIHLHPTAK